MKRSTWLFLGVLCSAAVLFAAIVMAAIAPLLGLFRVLAKQVGRGGRQLST